MEDDASVDEFMSAFDDIKVNSPKTETPFN